MSTARALSVSLGLLCAMGAPALALEADRGAWQFTDPAKLPRPGEPVFTVERNGWTIPGERRRDLFDRWFRPKKKELIRSAAEGDVYDGVFLAEAYAHGYRYYAGFTDGHWFRRKLHSVGQDRTKAEALFRSLVAAMDANPALRNTLVLTRFGRMRQAQGMHAEARVLFLRAAEAGDPTGMTLYANALRDAGEPASAWRPWYERAARDPVYSNREARLRLAKLLVDEGRFDEARELYVGSRTPHHYLQKIKLRLNPLVNDLEARLEADLIARVAQPNPDPELLYALVEIGPYRRTAQGWLEQAAAAGHAQAQFESARRLLLGSDAPQPAAITLLRQAAAQGHAGARQRLREAEQVLRVQRAQLRQELDGISGMLPD